MKLVAAFLSYVLALTIGIVAAFILDGREVFFVKPPAVTTSLKAASLLGTWNGIWGHNDGECTIEIERANGNTFHGTLRKGGAEIKFVGTIDQKTRRVTLTETEVVKLGANMTKWSLGENKGKLSDDGRILVGSGSDEWGPYGWAASR